MDINNSILIKYTDDEYGRSAKELGLIKRAYDGDAGIDLPIVLSKSEELEGGLSIFPDNRVILHTGICAAFPAGYWGRIVHRSSTEKKYRLRVIEGIIDEYRAELLIQVHNSNSFPVIIKHGQRLAQLIISKTYNFPCVEVDELPPSTRGLNGFGSSGS